MSPDPEVICEASGGLGLATLHRPKALNALTLAMVESIRANYEAWDLPTSAVHCILLRGAGGKAFCAGGDVKSCVLSARAGNFAAPMAFFREEYETDYLISRLTKPHIAIMDGIVMGGGAGLCMHGHFRIATERSLFAMPECAIGLFPDVGAPHFLGLLPGKLGLYLGLTGARLSGYDLKASGLATHYIPSQHLQQLAALLAALGPAAADLSVVDRTLKALEAAAGGPSPGPSILAKLPVINRCFGQPSVEQIAAMLRADTWDPQFCSEAAAMMAAGSPLSLKVTFELFRRAKRWDLATCFQAEFALVHRFVHGDGDFYEGVRAMLIERGSKPAWRYSRLEDVPSEAVEAFFRPLEPAARLRLPHGSGSAAAAAAAAGGTSRL